MRALPQDLIVIIKIRPILRLLSEFNDEYSFASHPHTHDCKWKGTREGVSAAADESLYKLPRYINYLQRPRFNSNSAAVPLFRFSLQLTAADEWWGGVQVLDSSSDASAWGDINSDIHESHLSTAESRQQHHLRTESTFIIIRRRMDTFKISELEFNELPFSSILSRINSGVTWTVGIISPILVWGQVQHCGISHWAMWNANWSYVHLFQDHPTGPAAWHTQYTSDATKSLRAL